MARKKSHPSLKERITLMNLLTLRGLKGGEANRVFMFVAMWGVYMDEHDGQEPGIEHFWQELPMPRATAYRWQALYRRAFPEWSTPAPLWNLVRGRVLHPDDAEFARIEIARLEVPEDLGARA